MLDLHKQKQVSLQHTQQLLYNITLFYTYISLALFLLAWPQVSDQNTNAGRYSLIF